MNRLSGRLWASLLVATISQGCVAIHAPLVADLKYPTSAWGEPIVLGPECRAVDGTYSNEGVVIGADGGNAQPLLLTSALNISSNVQAVSLSVRTRRLDRNGDAFITLSVVPNGNLGGLHELEGCFCIKQTLACTQVSETYWSVPNFGLGGTQKNIYFGLSHDHSLIAKLQNYHADVILGLPIFVMKEPWARFPRLDQ
jgi:hypothetical protein